MFLDDNNNGTKILVMRASQALLLLAFETTLKEARTLSLILQMIPWRLRKGEEMAQVT